MNNVAKIKKAFWIALGFISLGVGAVGVVLPVLPTTPFLMLASISFAKGSDKFRDWFLSTKLYKNHLEEFDKNRSMTLKTKISILIPVAIMLLITMYFMKNTHLRIFIGFLIAFKYWYFVFKIKTIEKDEKSNNRKI